MSDEQKKPEEFTLFGLPVKSMEPAEGTPPPGDIVLGTMEGWLRKKKKAHDLASLIPCPPGYI